MFQKQTGAQWLGCSEQQETLQEEVVNRPGPGPAGPGRPWLGVRFYSKSPGSRRRVSNGNDTIPPAGGKELPLQAPGAEASGALSQVLKKGVTPAPFKLLEHSEKQSILLLFVKSS